MITSEPQTVLPPKVVDMAATIESAIGLRHISLLGLAAAAYHAGWRDAMASPSAIDEGTRVLVDGQVYTVLRWWPATEDDGASVLVRLIPAGDA